MQRRGRGKLRLHPALHFRHFGKRQEKNQADAQQERGEAAMIAERQAQASRPKTASHGESSGTAIVKGSSARFGAGTNMQMSKKTKIPNRVTMSGFNIRIA